MTDAPQPRPSAPMASSSVYQQHAPIASLRAPITAPHHGWFTSPARSHANPGQAKELPLNLVALILSHIDDAGDLARITRASRLFYYMTLPRLYEQVTLRSYTDIRYVDGRPEGYGSGSPFAMALNTLVTRNYADYIHSFRLLGDWREHDVDDYTKGRVPDNSMMLQIAVRAAIDKMKNLKAFAWELNTKPLHTIYQGLVSRPSITTLTLRCQTKRIPRPTTLIPPLPNLITLVVYDIDPLCYPDDISLLLLGAKKIENVLLHWSPRMRDVGEESVNLLNYFGRCLAARHKIPAKRVALYNLYTRNVNDGMEDMLDPQTAQDITVINCFGSPSNPMTVFLDDTWRTQHQHHKVPPNLKMMRGDLIDADHVKMLSRFQGLERLYLINKRPSTKPNSTADTPATPSVESPSLPPSRNGTPTTVPDCKGLASRYLAVIQSNHRTMRHLLLSDRWSLSESALTRLLQSCPDLEQLGFACELPSHVIMRRIFPHVPNLWALRVLVRPNSEFDENLDKTDHEMHTFALATELWRPEYKNLRYIAIGDKFIYRLGKVIFPPKGKQVPIPEGQENSMNARRMGPIRIVTRVELKDVQHIEIWGLDTTEFVPKFP